MDGAHELCLQLRADEGLDAISKLDPGIITGPLTDVRALLSGAAAESCCVQVWWTFIQTLANDLGVAPDNGIVAAPYDWRLLRSCTVDCSQLAQVEPDDAARAG